MELMQGLADNSVDAVVTDPPYMLGFMGKEFDRPKDNIAASIEFWRRSLRVLKPGGHMLSFGGSRTYHRMACAIEGAGFEIRDQIMWVFGGGMPKKGYIKEAQDVWPGCGGSLKPAHEPIVVARKPLSEKNVASNVLKHGTGALNIDGCRVGTSKNVPASVSKKAHANCYMGGWKEYGEQLGVGGFDPNLGRWPANLIHDGSDEVLDAFPKEGRSIKPSASGGVRLPTNGMFAQKFKTGEARYSDYGSAARFFYCAKSSKTERNAGLNGTNGHPTVKPLELCQYLVRLICPPGGLVLDPFTGSGSIGCAAVLEGFSFIGIEREAEYVDIARQRITHYVATIKQRPSQLSMAV